MPRAPASRCAWSCAAPLAGLAVVSGATLWRCWELPLGLWPGPTGQERHLPASSLLLSAFPASRFPSVLCVTVSSTHISMAHARHGTGCVPRCPLPCSTKSHARTPVPTHPGYPPLPPPPPRTPPPVPAGPDHSPEPQPRFWHLLGIYGPAPGAGPPPHAPGAGEVGGLVTAGVGRGIGDIGKGWACRSPGCVMAGGCGQVTEPLGSPCVHGQ